MTKNKKLTISQLAKAAEIPTTTVRYYERIGLVEPEGRSHGNYRIYGDKSLERLKFVRAAQAVGFTLDDIGSLLGDGQSAPRCGDVKLLVEKRLLEVASRLKDLKHVQRVLRAANKQCEENNPRQRCHIVESLKQGS